MKLVVVTAFPPSKVTLNEYGFHLIKSLKNNPDVTEIIVYADTSLSEKDLIAMELDQKVKVRSVWRFNNPLNCWLIAKNLLKDRPDGVLFNLQFMKFGDNKVAAALGLLSPFISRLMGVPTISLLHNIMETVDLSSAGFANSKWLRLVYGAIGNALTRIILSSDRLVVTMQSYVTIIAEKYKANNILHIPHGTFQISTVPYRDTNKSKLQVMTFGKFGTYKKVEILLEACEMLRQRNQELEFEIVIAGTDNPNVSGYLEAVKNKYSHVNDLRFTGYVKEEDVAEVFTAADVVVFPYTSTTGSSGVLHQAGSYAKAVVMPDIGDLSDLITDEGYAAEFYTLGDSADFSMAIEKVLTDSSYRQYLGAQNFRAANAFPMSEVANLYVRAFEDVVLEKRGLVRSQLI